MDQFGRVLIIGMEHDHDIRAQVQRLFITGLLIGAIALILLMNDHMLDAQFFRFCLGVVIAKIVNDDHLVHDIKGDFIEGLFERFFGIISRHHHDDFLFIDHAITFMESIAVLSSQALSTTDFISFPLQQF